MSSTFVTLAEVLEARGGPLLEEEVWSLLLGTAESLVDVSYKGHNNMCNIISPTSLLLSATGTLAFKNCGLSDEVSTFTAPEMLQGRASSTKPAIERMLVYSLGMTLYWSVDFHLPQNQPVQLSDHLNSLLLSMCEDLAHRRVNLNSILEACESQHKASILPSPTKVIRQLVEEVFHESMDHGSLPDSNVPLSGRSQMIRERLHGKRGPFSDFSDGSAEGRRYSTDSDSKSGSLPQRPWRHRPRSSPTPLYQSSLDRLPRGVRHRDSNCSWLGRSPQHDISPKTSGRSHSPSITFSESSLSLSQRKARSLGPEFIRMPDEQHIVLELPGSIVSRKGRSCASQREVTVVLPNGQYVVVRCDIKSKARDVFDMVVAHANLVEHFYFGLAFLDDDEYFFLENETKISKVAPDGWKKGQILSFLTFLRVKYFVDDISFILHRLTRHQYYLQLRKDILEDRLYCNEETGLFLVALALQAEFGDYMPELYGKNYYQPEHYVSKRMLEKLALPTVKEELPRLHASHAQMLPEEAETEYLKIAQQLPEYGVMFHRVGREKRPVVGELVLGVCAKGIIVYEMKNHLRTVTRRFLWRETDSISTGRRKLIIECGGPSGKKHSFVTESSKIAQYLLNLCSAQHKFHSEMTSRQLNHTMIPDENMAVYRGRNLNMKRMSCSEGMLNHVGLAPGQPDSLSKSCDDLTAKLEERLRQQREMRREMSREMNKELPETGDFRDMKERPCWSTPETIPRMMSSVSLQKQDSDTSSSIRVDTPTRTPPEREIVCVSLKKDPKLGFGFVIVGEDNTGKLDLGIFIASIVPEGPADRDGRIKPGGRLISLNKTSLEGVTFSDAAAILQSSPDEVELIVSQPKQSLKESKSSLSQSTLGLALERGFGSQTTLSGSEYRPAMEELEEAISLSSMATPRLGKRLHIPVVRIHDAQDACSRSPSILSLKAGERFILELKKSSGSLGISVAGGINTNVRYGGIYIKSLVPGGAAEQDGRIQNGDRLLEVDGFDLRAVNHHQAVECLKRTGEVVNLLLEREPTVMLEPRPDSPCPQLPHSPSVHTQPPRTEVSMETTLSGRVKDYSFVTDDNTHEVVLRKSLSGLGFSFNISHIRTGPDRGSVVRIKRLFPGQPALESGLLREGDIILSVNKEPVKDLSYQRVLFLLRGAPSEVHLLICRSGPGMLYEADDNTLSPAHFREVRSRSLDLRLGEDYSTLLKFQYDVKLLAQRQADLAQEEALISTAEQSSEPSAAPAPLSTEERVDSEVRPNLPPPSPPRSPPSPTSPTSPPSPVSPASPASPTSPASPGCGFPPAPPELQPTAGKPGEQREVGAKEKKRDEKEEAPTTPSSTVMLMDAYPKTASNYASGVREEADGSLTYCLMGNGLTIMADEEYLTISSTLEPPHNLPSSQTTHTATATLRSHTSLTSQNPNLGPHIPTTSTVSPLGLSSDTPTTCSLAHPVQPLTTQPPKAKHHPIQQGLLPSHYKVMSKNGRPVVPPPQPPTPPVTPITAQVMSSVPPCASPPAPMLPPTVLPPPAQSHIQMREEHERREREYRDDDDDDEMDEEEEESRRKGTVKEFELTVILTKSRSGSFGFTITRSKLDNCYYIQEILDNPAKADGRLRAGDRLITVNGHDVTSVADDVAMTILRSSPRRLSMTLGRAVSNLVAPPSCDSLPDVVLHKTPSGQLGIKLTGGIGSKWQGIYCLEVVPGSPASEEGSVQPSDKILYICGRCTLGMTLEDAVKACEIAPRKVKLKILREDHPVNPRAKWNGLFDWKKDKKFFARFEEPVSPEKESPNEDAEAVCRTTGSFRCLSLSQEHDSCIMQVDFTKPEGGGLGFALVGGTNGSMLRVKEICSGGVAEQDGRLKVGDILLEVNGVIVSGLSHNKVVDILRKAEGSVQLTICRDILPMTYCESPSPPNMSAQTEAVLAEQPAPVSSPDACSSPDVMLNKPVERPPEAALDPVVNEAGAFLNSPPPPRHRRLTIVTDETEIKQESCNSTPSHQACCPSLNVTDMLHGASDRKHIVTKLLDQSCKDIRKTQSDGWSSEEDDDNVFDATGRETTSPQTGPPIVSEEELAGLALISPAKTSQYSGSRVKALIQILQHQLDQQELVKEFMALEHLKPSDNCLVGKAPENRDKNRYRDILPYDKTRVALGDNQDYINASYIRMQVGDEEFFYISCQGPLPSTVPAFWQMIWESKSDVIAMMTQEVERGRIKCHKYWPEKLSVPLDTGRFQIHLENQQYLEYFHIKVIRILETETGETHLVRHLKFTHWPDHGVPHSSEHLVRFIRYLRAVHNEGPVTVHCSAGIGRTGVLICTDVLLSLIENDLPVSINVSDIVKGMRLQRHGMIQTKEQYLFCYKVWLEVLQGILQLHGNQWQPESPRDHKVV
ncbi:tyrosine-protein phosphatase non-receptor type 13 isoform X1 [Sparus aurata]|uniref:tyrosine-protein phosphatase non-receptor type 13 isoform X1 n=1 Tax=Sparus aurata TaxID=8175 RepID=UPI0011C1AF03|nr:tyrosine-protein phosphatase non-receptor type 13-like isoform X1 [Sparus aurata]XP_030298622.1 tyrosine-protein phosphatase non-receptor type 13-like isoform X1 [Sparus aurata]XP_030298625.1 tyrosine-protein phosphatase non-receptor type 13-like isoform X1 [Sparus aurata]XP_030298626.1 tyrosine-protein phosphatase non-receptor type 13-like isoform X1 [Sparus aurata]